MPTSRSTNVRVEITEETLTRLIMAGQVCAADLRCLDCKSKKCLWRLCLESCARKLATGKEYRSVNSDSFSDDRPCRYKMPLACING